MSGQVYPFLPSWPMVRCDNCHTVYHLNTDSHKRVVLVTGACPKCGGETFSTVMKSGQVVA